MKYQKLKRNLYTACVVANLFLIPSPVLWAEQSYAQSTRLSLELSNATISDVFASVEKNSEYRFFYSDAVRAELYRNVDVNIKNKTIDRILSEVLDGTNLTYFLNDRQVMIIRKEEKRSKRKKYQSTELSGMPNRNLCPESTYWSKERSLGVGANGCHAGVNACYHLLGIVVRLRECSGCLLCVIGRVEHVLTT